MSYQEDENWWVDKWKDEADEDDCHGESSWREDFHADEAIGPVFFHEDDPFDD